jgi:hypothetical protein
MAFARWNAIPSLHKIPSGSGGYQYEQDHPPVVGDTTACCGRSAGRRTRCSGLRNCRGHGYAPAGIQDHDGGSFEVLGGGRAIGVPQPFTSETKPTFQLGCKMFWRAAAREKKPRRVGPSGALSYSNSGKTSSATRGPVGPFLRRVVHISKRGSRKPSPCAALGAKLADPLHADDGPDRYLAALLLLTGNSH